MKAKNARRALLMSVLSLFVCVSMLVGTTFAWFTDSVTSANNIIKSGTLDVTMEWMNGTEDPAAGTWTDASTGAIFNYDLWEPGYTEVRHIKIANVGNLALKYQIQILANGEVSDLADVIDVYYIDPATQVADRTALNDSNKLGTLTQALGGMATSANGALSAGESDTITIALKMQESAGNEYQNKSIGSDFSIILLATQMTAETDSFDDQYDAGAAYPVVTNPIPIPEGGPMTIGDNVIGATLPEGLVDDLQDDASKLSIKYDPPKVDIVNKTIVFNFAEVVDERGKVVDLEAMGNDKPFEVKLDVNSNFAEGDIVNVYHDSELVANPTVDAEGYITYEALHFCKVTVSSAPVYYIRTADDISAADYLVRVLTNIKTSAKAQIPGENGNKKYRESAIFVLEEDIVIDSGDKFMYTDSTGALLHFYGVKGVLDFNGHTIKVTEKALLDGKTNANAVLLFQYSNMILKGEGGIIAANKSIPVYAWANCTVDIYGGNYVTNASERNESAVYVNNASALVNVYGGTYTDSAYAFNVHDNCGTTPVMVLHEGITYADFLKGTTDLTNQDLEKGRIVVADGCELVKDGAGKNEVKAK